MEEFSTKCFGTTRPSRFAAGLKVVPRDGNRLVNLIETPCHYRQGVFYELMFGF